VIDEFMADATQQETLIEFMKTIAGIDIKLGFEYKDGFLAIVNIYYSTDDSSTLDLMPFYFVQVESKYLLSAVTLDEAIDTNITLCLQQGYSVADLLKPPAEQHSLTVEKSGTGDGTVTGSGIDCGPDCIEVYQEGVVVFLKAEPDADSVFDGWLVDGNPPQGRIEMTKDMNVIAIFNKK
jgi:hypothetical protein